MEVSFIVYHLWQLHVRSFSVTTDNCLRFEMRLK